VYYTYLSGSLGKKGGGDDITLRDKYQHLYEKECVLYRRTGEKRGDL
jgi:hypothetical protein